MKTAAAAVTAALAIGCCVSPARAGRADPPTGEFARARGAGLLMPARRVVAFAYHESLFHPALPLRPLGRPTVLANPAFEPPRRRGDRPRYLVMASRGRGTPATSAVDVVLRRRTPVLAPVTGVVVDTSPYRLYCRRADRRVIIKPAGAPQLRVVIFHVERVVVRRGQRVTAGVTPIGRPRIFRGLTAQYDAYVPGGHPHVHVEVERRPTRPLPGCRW